MPRKSSTATAPYAITILKACHLCSSLHLTRGSGPRGLNWTVSDGIWYCLSLWGFVVLIGHEQLSLLIMGGGPIVDDNYRQFNYLSDFAEKWLECVYMCQDDTCEIISLSDHPFKGYAQKSRCTIYAHHWMRHTRFCVNLSGLWHGIRLCNTMHLGVVPQYVYVN